MVTRSLAKQSNPTSRILETASKMGTLAECSERMGISFMQGEGKKWLFGFIKKIPICCSGCLFAFLLPAQLPLLPDLK